MANVVKIKRGSGTPTTSNLAQYELGYDYTNDKLYIHDPTNSAGQEIVEITGSSFTLGPVADGATTIATGNAIYDHVTSRISGFVDTSGTPVAQEYARFTDANTIEGRSAAGVRTDLGLVIGTNVLEYNAELQTIAALNPTATEDGKVLSWNENNEAYELIAQSVGTITSVSGMTNDNVLTASGSTTINGESNLTFDGTFLELTDSQLRLDNSTFGTYNWEFQQEDGGDLVFKIPATGGAEVRINADGSNFNTTKVDIGGEIRLSANGASYFKSASAPLTIGGGSAFTIGGTPRLSLQGAGLNIGINANDLSYIRRIATGEYQWQTWNGANDGELHLQPYGGKVGIGTTTPGALLDVNGTAYLRTAVFSDTFKPYSGTLATYGSSSSTDHYFVGDVGIGTNSPANRVHILGDANNAALRVQRGDNTGQNLYFRGYQIYNAGNHLLVSAADTKELRFGHVSSTAQLVLDSSGNISTGVWQGTPIANAYIADNSINAAKLDVSGNGSNGQVLKSNGDGTFSWFTLVSSSNASTLDNLDSTQFLRSDADDTASGQYNFTKVNDHAIKVGTIRGTTVGSGNGSQYIHLYERVHIGSPSGWGSRTAPSNGLSTYGGADLATDTGDVTIGGNLKLTREKGLLWDYTPNTGHGGYIAHPGGGMYRTSTGSHTGALTITIPSGGGPADMISFWVDVFDYVSYESQSFYIAGYVYQTAGSNEWVNETAMMLTPKENHARTVRFGHNGTNHVVYIGELADTWSYPQVTVRNVQVGFNSDVDTYDDNWDISFEASAFANVDATYSGADTLPTAGKIKMKDGAGKFVHNTTSSRDKIRVWNSSNYAIGMQSGFTFGGLDNQYAMTFNMNDQSTRGFWWGDDGHGQGNGAMALTTDGKATIAHSLRLGYGESDTTTPGASYKLDVSGNSLVTGTMFASKLQTDSGNLILSGGGWGMNFYIDTDANSGDNYNFYSDNSLRHILGGDGNVTFGKVANPTLSIMNTATAAGSGPTLEFGHDQGGGARAGAISTYLTDGSVANRTSLLRFWHTQANADILKLQLGDNYVRQYQKGDASDYLETIVNDDHAEFHVASGNYVKISTDSGYVNIGAQNPSWAHFYTDRPGWYFDKGPTSGNGVFQSYSNLDLSLRRSQGTADRIDIAADYSRIIVNDIERFRATTTGATITGHAYASSSYLAPDGSAGTPAYRFNNDGDTGMLLTQADTIGFATGGSTRFTMSSAGVFYASSAIQAGNAGVQIWDPTHGFRTVLAKDSTYTKLLNNDGTVMMYMGDSGDAQMYYQANEHRFRNLSGSAYYARIGSGYIRSEGNGSEAAPAFSFQGDTNTGIYLSGADDMAFVAGGYERFAANGNGLDLSNGSVNKIVMPASSTRDKYRVWTSSAYAIGMQNSFTFGGLGTDYAMTFQMSNTATRGFWWGDASHGQGAGAMAVTTEGKLTVAHSARIGYGESDTTTPGATYRLDVSGSIGATADVVAYVSSDKRLKDNIKNIANPLEKLEKLNGVEFDWNDKQDLYKGHDIGVIAQEVEEVLPEIVDTREDGHKAVKYDRMVALLIEAVKEQQQQINELKEKLNG